MPSHNANVTQKSTHKKSLSETVHDRTEMGAHRYHSPSHAVAGFQTMTHISRGGGPREISSASARHVETRFLLDRSIETMCVRFAAVNRSASNIFPSIRTRCVAQKVGRLSAGLHGLQGESDVKEPRRRRPSPFFLKKIRNLAPETAFKISLK